MTNSIAEYIWEFIILITLLIASIKFYNWLGTMNTRHPRWFNTPTIPLRLDDPPAPPASIPTSTVSTSSQSRARGSEQVAGPLDPCDHPYTPLPLTDLTTHVFENHFEVWNSIAERNPSPKAWQTEHKRDHNQL